MLTVETYLAPSNIHGIGLFAARTIVAGELIWYLDHRIDIVFDDFDRDLPAIAASYLRRYAYHCRRNNVWILCGDDGRFFNHAEKPNTREDYTGQCPFGVDLAARDIIEGEELTTDYRGFDNAAKEKIL